jgi:conjugal transfer pilus assembly protein TraV
MNLKYFSVSILITFFLSGCAGFSGLDAENKFSCKAPDGVTCLSVSGIYTNAKANNLPGLRKRTEVDVNSGRIDATRKHDDGSYGTTKNNLAMLNASIKTSPKNMDTPHSGMPLRTPERILRIWLAPFEDYEGDLHDQKYFYVTVNSGSWTIEANRVNIRSQFQKVFPLSKANAENKRTESENALVSPQQQASQMLPVSPVVQQQGADDASQP